jgi:predicted GTPase
MAKFDRNERTLETRVSFIREIFTNKYKPIEIMANCIQYKLDKSYEVYLKDVLKSVWNLNGQDPLKILKRVDSDGKEI